MAKSRDERESAQITLGVAILSKILLIKILKIIINFKIGKGVTRPPYIEFLLPKIS